MDDAMMSSFLGGFSESGVLARLQYKRIAAIYDCLYVYVLISIPLTLTCIYLGGLELTLLLIHLFPGRKHDQEPEPLPPVVPQLNLYSSWHWIDNHSWQNGRDYQPVSNPRPNPMMGVGKGARKVSACLDDHTH